jgi:hypothetical protein
MMPAVLACLDCGRLMWYSREVYCSDCRAIRAALQGKEDPADG